MKSRTNELAGVCGQYCGTCSVYIATQEDPKALKQLADQYGLSEEEVRCNGCRSIKRGHNCEQCEMFDCAWEKGNTFCHECDDYPCAKVDLFMTQPSPRKGLWKNIKTINKVGCEAWIKGLENKITHSTNHSICELHRRSRVSG